MRSLLLIAMVLVSFGGCEQPTAFASPKVPDHSRPASAYQVYSFTADWCPACQRDKPKLAELRQRGVEVIEIDYDARPELARKYRVRRLPTYVVLKDGEEVERTESILLLIKILRFLLRLF